MQILRAFNQASGLGGGGPQFLDGQLNPDWAAANPGRANSWIADEQWRDFELRYRPLEDRLIQEFFTSPEAAAREAGSITAGAHAGNADSMARQVGRYGVSMTPDQQRAASRSSGLAAARDIAGTENMTRRSIRDRNIEGLGTMMGIGKGISGGAMDSMGQAAGLASAREQAGQQARAAARQNNRNTAMSMLGMAAMFAL